MRQIGWGIWKSLSLLYPTGKTEKWKQKHKPKTEYENSKKKTENIKTMMGEQQWCFEAEVIPRTLEVGLWCISMYITVQLNCLRVKFFNIILKSWKYE